MADHSSATRIHVPAAPPLQISKDFQGADNPIPLSPQWLLPKPGESKPETGTVDNPVISAPPTGNRIEAVKTSGNGDDVHDGHKRKDVFRPSMLDSESGRRDRWRDEERDTRSLIRKDRWRDGDKDQVDARKLDRWSENPPARHFGETRRSTSDRWNDSGSRETNNDQRRESKWNTRWGPDGKEPEGLREKWSDSGKDGDLHQDKGLSHNSNTGKDEKEGDHYRPWRPSSFQSRGRVDPPHYQNMTPNKQVPAFSHGRGRVEDSPPVITLGRARLGSSGSSINNTYLHSQYAGEELGEARPFRYSRTKLLDVYKVTDMHTDRKLVNDFVQIPSLTQDEPLEPLALFAPTSEELSVLKDIDKGEIISSSAPQVPKDGRNSTEFTHSRRMKLGNSPFQDRGEDGGAYRVSDEVPSNKGPTFEDNSSVHPSDAWRAMPLGDHASTLMHDSKDVPGDLKSRNSDLSWSNQPIDPRSRWDSNLDYLSESQEVAKRQSTGDSLVKRQLTGILDSELEARRVPQTSPEEMSLFYKDPQGQVQGPFKGIDIIGWFEAGYFGIDLPVRSENAASDTPWCQLGDAMPHLRAKARPPPGFSPAKFDPTEAPARQNSSAFGTIHTSLSDVEMLRNDSIHRQSSATEAENRFFESLMSGSKSSPPLDGRLITEGLQGFARSNSGNLGSSGVDSGNDVYLLSNRMALERQRSLHHPYPFWPGSDATFHPPKSDIFSDASPHSKLLPSVSDSSRQRQSQNSELFSISQGLSDRSSTGLNNGVAGLPNYALQGGFDPLQNKIDLHHVQNFHQMPFGIQQQRLQAPNQLSISNLIAPTIDNQSSILTAEKLLSSGLTQDPQILNLLQQKGLLQLHSQAAAPAQQMPLLDKLLLLKQQEEQQLLFRQQQQQLLSQVLQEHHPYQLSTDFSYGQLQGGGIPIGNSLLDHSQLKPQQEFFPISSQTPIIPGVLDEHSSNSLNLPLQVSQETGYNLSSEFSVQLPRQLFGNDSHQKSWGPSIPEQINEKYQKETLPASASVESSILHEQNRTEEEAVIKQKPLSASDYTAKSVEQMQDNSCCADGILASATSECGECSQPVRCAAPSIAISLAVSCGIDLPLASQLCKDVEIRSDNLEEQQARRDSSNIETSVVEVRNVEAREPKKATEKKSKKQKSSKSLPSDQAKGLPKNLTSQQSKNSEAEKPNATENIFADANKGELSNETYLQQTRGKGHHSGIATVEGADHQEVSKQLPVNIPGGITETAVENELKAVSSVASLNTELTAGRAWKPAPGFKAKSLLEIQQEEQKKAKTEMFVTEIATPVNSTSSTTPWVGVVANADSTKVSSESHRESGKSEYLAKPETSQIKKSPLHDLLADVKKSCVRDGEVPNSMPTSQTIAVYSEPVDDGDFIEAKDTKRSRKKSAKSTGSGAKVSTPVASSEVPISSSPIEKGKSSRSVLQEKEQLPAIPSGPSLGDFVPWKGEPTSPSPSPAWTTDSGRVPKPTSLRDILKEQEKKSSSAAPPNQLPTQKSQPAQAARNSAPSWPISASSTLKAAPSSQINSQASQSKYKGDDDLFWGPIEHSKQETKQSDFPQLAGQGSLGSKIVPMKANSPGPLSRQKSGGGKLTERSLSSSPASSHSLLKMKKDAMTKNSEAMDFRVWCENECVRLIGTKDTSFLEFCLKQSRSEAEMYLRENLGSYDPDHEFIDKFLNYMDLLPSDVLEIAFQTQNDQKVIGGISGNTDLQDLGYTEVSSSKGGKKKGKKGKKVSSAVLGFNVVSNRIMMGEIQAAED